MRVLIVGGIFGRPLEYKAGIWGTPETNLLEGLLEKGVEARGVPHTWLPERSRADIVHVHHLAKGVVAYAMARPLWADRMLFTRHGLEGDLSVARRGALQVALRRADAVVALSEFEARALRRHVKGRLQVIPNGIKSPAAGEPLAPPDHIPRWWLLYVGQLIPLKKVDVLLRAIAAVSSSIDIELRLVYHNSALDADLRRLADRLGIADRVTFVGSRGPVEVFQEYANAHALVLPSMTEALPSVVTEALMSARPVVDSAVGGVPEQVGDAGILVPANDVAALSAAIGTLATHFQTYLRAAMARARQVIEESSGQLMADRHIKLYKELLGTSDGRGPS